MKNLLLIAVSLLLFASCKKEEEGPKGDELTGRTYRNYWYGYNRVTHTDMTFELGNLCLGESITYQADTILEDHGSMYWNYEKLDNSNFIGLFLSNPTTTQFYYVTPDSLCKVEIRGNDTVFLREFFTYYRIK